MTLANSSTLFHFTNEYEVLEKILENGVRYSYALETVDRKVNLHENSSTYIDDFTLDMLLSPNAGVGIPMACFCDIPLLRAGNHKDRYGCYAIGFDKDILCNNCANNINPVLYTKANWISELCVLVAQYKRDIRAQFGKIYKGAPYDDGETDIHIDKTSQLHYYHSILNNFLGLRKAYSETDSEGNTVCYYDEREWRAIWVDNSGEQTRWKWGIDKDEFEQKKPN